MAAPQLLPPRKPQSRAGVGDSTNGDTQVLGRTRIRVGSRTISRELAFRVFDLMNEHRMEQGIRRDLTKGLSALVQEHIPGLSSVEIEHINSLIAESWMRACRARELVSRSADELATEAMDDTLGEAA